MSRIVSRAQTVALWAATIILAVAIGSPGLGKLITNGEWDRLFASWGYPSWFRILVGVVEVLGAAALFVRRIAWVAAFCLSAVMVGAFSTLIAHPGSHLFRGKQAPIPVSEPVVWFGLLLIVGTVRLRQSRAPVVSSVRV